LPIATILNLAVTDYKDTNHWHWRLTDAGGHYLADREVQLNPTDFEYATQFFGRTIGLLWLRIGPGLGGGSGRGGGGAGGLEATQFREGLFVGPLGEGDATLQAHEYSAGLVESFAEGYAVRSVGVRDVVFPEMGFDAEEAAQGPLVADERVDVETLLGSVRLEAPEVLLLQQREIGAILTVDELRFGIETGLEGVLGGPDLALPSGEVGPVDFCELTRLASSCA
jgi:hypothetical protein